MSVMDKFLNYMKLNGEEDDEYYDDDYLDDEEDLEPAPKKQSVSRVKEVDTFEDAGAAKKTVPGNKITPINKPTARRMNNGAGMEVCVIKPTSVDDGRDITQMLSSNRTVVLNLEGLDMDLAQRITDFVCGSCCAISGKLQKISNYILIITPASVDISGDYQDMYNDSFDGVIND